MSCPGPIWVVDDVSPCFRARYLQIAFPLATGVVSILVLSITGFFHWRRRGRGISPRKQDPPAWRRDYGGESTPGTPRLFAPNRPLVRRSLAVLEQLLVLTRIAFSWATVSVTPATPFLRPSRPQAEEKFVLIAGVVAWGYIFTLNSWRIYSFGRAKALYSTLWLHATVFYLIQWLFEIVVARSVIIRQDMADVRLSEMGKIVVETLLVAIVVLTPAYQYNDHFVPRSSPQKSATLPELSKESTASLFGLATFAWVDTLVWKGYKKTLELQDVWALDRGDETANVLQDFRTMRSTGRWLTRLLYYSLDLFCLQAVWAALLSLTTFAPTLLLRAIVEYVEDPSNVPLHVAWLYVVLMFLMGLFIALMEGQAAWIGQRISLRLRTIAISEIYEKSLRRKAFASGDTSSGTANATDSPTPETAELHVNIGTIINLMSVDAFHIGEVGGSLHLIWLSVPLQIVIALLLLYQTLGVSAIPGIVTMLLMFPFNSIIAKRFGKLQMELMGATDGRMNVTNEMLRNIRIIKYFTWEDRCLDLVNDKRDHELKILRRRFILWSVAATIWYIAPLLITFFSFVSYTALEKKELRPSIAFTALSLFGLLKVPLDQFADIIAKVQSSLASAQRVERFLNEQETGKYSQLAHENSYHDDDEGPRIGFRDATISWDTGPGSSAASTRPSFAFKRLDIEFLLNGLNLIIGPTGSGKSSLLMALLGEMNLHSGKIYLPHSRVFHDPRVDSEREDRYVAYCAQTPWLLNDTIRSNITFTLPWDEKRYQETIAACALEQDIGVMAQGDMTLVGEKGMSLSGGQKQRISLARAIYSSAEVVLLDDCLSAVDSHTAQWVFDRCIRGQPMQERTCILVTHNIALCGPRADLVVALERGQVVACDAPNKVAMVQAFCNDQQRNPAIFESHSGLAPGESPKKDPTDGNILDAQISDSLNDHATNEAENEVTKSSLEAKADGQVKWSIVFNYLAMTGGVLFWASLIVVFAAQLLGSIMTNVWISKFSNSYAQSTGSMLVDHGHDSPRPFSDGHISPLTLTLAPSPSQANALIHLQHNRSVDTLYYLGVYALIILGYLIVSFLRMILVSLGSLVASQKLHTRLVTAVFRAKFAFFNLRTHGQIMNRFSKDMQTVDQELASMALGTVHFIGSVICILVLITIITPAFTIAGVLISLAYWAIGKLYINSSRDLKRIESVQRSPLYQSFGESLEGIVTIRAYGKERIFREHNSSHVNTLNRPFIGLWAVDRWLAFRLDVTGGLVAFFAGSLAILGIGRVDAGAVGLSLTYAITFSENILWLVRYHALNQQNFTAAERIQEFIAVRQETQEAATNAVAQEYWPVDGGVRFFEYSARYLANSEVVLKNVSFDIPPRSKIGIVGRTGAGKSSLALALLRVLEPANGKILIDGIDIGSVGLKELRQAVTLVPQDPTLFSGTLRFNLDPAGTHMDSELLSVLKKVHLIDGHDSTRAARSSAQTTGTGSHQQRHDHTSADVALTFFSDLDSVLVDSGTNISQGQRQLVCLARAILRNSKVIVLDEATASIDYNTASKIQQTLDAVDATNITIAHRLQTIINFDKVLVLDHGEVKEFDHPSVLLQNQKGLFRAMCEAEGNFDFLMGLAKKTRE